MLVKTKYFGEIDLTEDKIITLDNGLMGFENYKKYTILYDSGADGQPNISWLQSVEEPGLALPVISPFLVKPDYNPVVEDEVLKPLGELNEENLAIFLVLTVPSRPEEVTANLKAPVIINADTRQGCQIIVENKDYVIKYKVYDAIQKMKEEKGEMSC